MPCSRSLFFSNLEPSQHEQLEKSKPSSIRYSGHLAHRFPGIAVFTFDIPNDTADNSRSCKSHVLLQLSSKKTRKSDYCSAFSKLQLVNFTPFIDGLLL